MCQKALTTGGELEVYGTHNDLIATLKIDPKLAPKSLLS